jgi:hypothetical protein
MMKPQDVVVLAKFLPRQKEGKNWTQATLAEELCLSLSQVNYALKRLLTARLLAPVFRKDNNNDTRPVPITQSCEEFLIHEFKFVFPPEFGSQSPGIPTAYAATAIK